ncbi:FAD-dependent oxidoreductase [Actinoplanes sp. NPDC051494]|uniref:flavin monoamine oxidase family protein n=1 Tax=Actinoplanes sp. NPDC051494 TaxID=3363907 RepID=UPI0037AF87BD
MLRAFLVSRWGDDPWSRGSWSLIGRGGTPADRTTLGAPAGPRLRIAGEATHATRAGMAHGAYEKGTEAAAWAADLGHRRVVVIGAGMAGLAAARHLTRLGVHAEVWEARDRLGGRTAGADLDGFTFDLGANWLQQYPENALARVAERLGLRTVATDFSDPLVLSGGVPASPAVAEEVARRLAAAPVEASVEDALRPWTPEIRRFADAEIMMDSGAPLSWLSARHGFEPGVGEGDRWIAGSFRPLVEHLARGITVHLSRPVENIRTDPDGVRVNGAPFDAAIVTVPVSVLHAGVITFDPPLPDAQLDALSRLGMGRVEKVVLRFAEHFWPVYRSGYHRVHGPADGDICEWLDASAGDGTPTVAGLFAGPWLDALWAGSDAEIAGRAAAVLRSAVRSSS